MQSKAIGSRDRCRQTRSQCTSPKRFRSQGRPRRPVIAAGARHASNGTVSLRSEPPCGTAASRARGGAAPSTLTAAACAAWRRDRGRSRGSDASSAKGTQPDCAVIGRAPSASRVQMVPDSDRPRIGNDHAVRNGATERLRVNASSAFLPDRAGLTNSSATL